MQHGPSCRKPPSTAVTRSPSPRDTEPPIPPGARNTTNTTKPNKSLLMMKPPLENAKSKAQSARSNPLPFAPCSQPGHKLHLEVHGCKKNPSSHEAVLGEELTVRATAGQSKLALDAHGC